MNFRMTNLRKLIVTVTFIDKVFLVAVMLVLVKVVVLVMVYMVAVMFVVFTGMFVDLIDTGKVLNLSMNELTQIWSNENVCHDFQHSLIYYSILLNCVSFFSGGGGG